VSAAMPAAIGGNPRLDVQPDNQIVVTVDFSLVLVRFEVGTYTRLTVEDGRVKVSIERIEAGGRNLLDLIGMDQIALGDEITGLIQQTLENELGPGSRLLAIATDEDRVILTARWE